MSAAVEVACSRCCGTGRRRLPPHLARTLAAIGPTWLPSTAIQRLLAGGGEDVEHTALCMRLRRLEEHGLVERRASESLPRGLDWRRRKES